MAHLPARFSPAAVPDLAYKASMPLTVQPPVSLLRERLRQYDAIRMTVRSSGAQEYEGRVDQIYSRRFEGPEKYDQPPFRFVGTPGHWGNPILHDGEVALVFLRYSGNSRRYYQQNWHGHMTVVSLKGSFHAVVGWHLSLEGSTWGPAYLRNAVFLPDSSKPWQLAFPFHLVEMHIYEELQQLGSGAAALRS